MRKLDAAQGEIHRFHNIGEPFQENAQDKFPTSDTLGETQGIAN